MVLVDVDFEYGGASPDDLKELQKIPAQLKPDYLFDSDKALPEDKRDPISNHLVGGVPRFHAYEAKPGEVSAAAEKIRNAYGVDPTDVILIGNGGSISSSEAVYDMLLKYGDGPRLHIVDSMDPDQITAVKGICDPSSTVVVAVSKSGKTQGVLDALTQFTDYSLAAVTTKEDGRPLYELVKKAVGGKADDVIVDHPPIGGRYTGRTPVATLPLALLGMSAEEMKAFDQGAQEMYLQVLADVTVERNQALWLAASLYQLEQSGYEIIFAPMYSHRFDGFAHLITQLLHESSGKLGRGQVILTAAAPESQHHTNQRLFGGKRNMAAVFFTIGCEHAGLKAADGTPLHKVLEYEYQGTRDTAVEEGIPNFTVRVEKPSAEAAGSLMAFCHYAFGVYPALLRNVNPFDQPRVERSKEISRQLRD